MKEYDAELYRAMAFCTCNECEHYNPFCAYCEKLDEYRDPVRDSRCRHFELTAYHAEDLGISPKCRKAINAISKYLNR